MRTRLRAALALVLALVAGAALAGPAQADVYAPGDWAPSIWSDKADYGPGEQVTLSGAQWQPGETVSIVVNDDAGSTWRREVDVTAGEAGMIEDRFDLPSWFVAEYSVKATGSSGAVATTSFTDANTVYSPGRVPASDRLAVTAGSSAAFTVAARKEGSGPVEVTGLQAPADTAGCGTGGAVLPAGWLTINQTVPFSLGGSNADVRFRVAPPSGATPGNYKALVKFAVDGNAQNPAQAGLGFVLCVRVDAATQDQTITFEAPSGVTYGDADRDLGATASSGLAVSYGSSTPAVCTVVSGKLHVVAAGDCSVTASQGGNAGWNAATPVTRSFTVAKAPLSATADDASREYGEANPELTGRLVGVKNGDAVAFAASTAATEASGVGTYPIAAKIVAEDAVLANYAVELLDGALTVTKAPLSATADDASREYGDENPDFTGELSGVKNGDEIAAAYASDAKKQSGVGEYAIVPSVSAAEGVLANYAVELVDGTLTITKAPLSAKADDQEKVYGDENPELTGKLVGVKNGDAIAFAASTAATEASGVGTYPIAANVIAEDAVLANYQAPELVDGTLTVTKAPLSATADDASREYGDENPEFTGSVAGVKNGDAITATYGSAATATSGVGEHAIVPAVHATDDVLANYAVELVDGTLTITKAPLSAEADDQEKVYGDENPELTGKLTGVKNGDAIAFGGSTQATKASGVGTYPIAANVIAEDAVLANYQAPELTDGTLTVTKAPLTANVSDETVEYGEPATFTASYAGLKNDDTASAVDGTLSCTPARTDAGGPYGVDCSGLTAANYAIAYKGGSLTVTKAELKVVAQDLTRVYGESSPAPASKLAGFKNGETKAEAGVTGSADCRIDAGSDAGTYADAITCEPGTLEAANYRFATGAKGTLTIAKADQTITFPSIGTKKLGDADFEAAATASSGLTVSYAAAPASVCAIVAGKVRAVGIGTCTVTASQGGSGNYHAAADVARQFAVVFPFTGFFAPVDMGQGVLNKAKAGSTIPVKFRLGGDRGLGILAAGSPSSGAVACDAGAVVDTIEELATATTSGLKYDALADQYIYNWKTDAKFASTCRQLVVKLADGQSYRANFTFTK